MDFFREGISHENSDLGEMNRIWRILHNAELRGFTQLTYCSQSE
jgi:hypothetical protein